MAKKKVETKLGTLNDIPTEGYVPTGVPELDEILGGGFPRRRITQIYGQPGVGKSYLLAKCMAGLDGKILYVDSEFALNRERLEEMGIPMDKIDYLPSSQLEEVAERIIADVGKYDLIIIDTLTQLTPMTVTTNEVGATAIGLAARQIGHFVAKLRPELYKSECAIIGINQVRANFGMGQVQTQAFGGWSWGHNIDLSIKLFKGANNQLSKQKNGVKYLIGHVCSAKLEKGRTGTPMAETKFEINYAHLIPELTAE